MPTASSTPRGKWITAALWLVGLIVLAGALQLPSKFAGEERNESTSFLPGDAESTRALDVTEKLRGGDTAPTVIVFQRRGGLTARDRATIQAQARALDAFTAKYPNTTPFRGPEVSPDGSTALITNVVKGTGDGKDIVDPVEDYRDALRTEAGRRDGLIVKVGGPSGISADAIKIFESINGTLLLAALALVFVLLILIYRSPIFWVVPLLSVGVAEVATRSFGYFLTQIGVTVNGQSSSIMSVIVLGAGTDYALLLVARYKEELRRHEDAHEAMGLALRAAGPAIFASGLTVAATLLSLTIAKVNGTAGLGPTGALGVLMALLTMLTLLPALLTIIPRWFFWPSVPRYGDRGTDETHGAWRGVGERVAARPRRVWIGTGLVLLLCALGTLNFSTGLTQGNAFRDDVEGIEAQQLVAGAFPAGSTAPTDVVVSDPSRADAVLAALRSVDGVAGARVTERSARTTVLGVALEEDPYSTAAYATIEAIRGAVRRADPGALVGGPTAVEKDLRDAATDDTLLLVPIALLIVSVILLVLLRAVVGTLILIGSVILSFAASLGVAAVVYDVVFGFPGSDPSLPLFAFIFLVALGVDYNIFLIARVREEAGKYGTRPGMTRGLAVTGGVITSAGIVLAGTFAVLGVLPLVFLTEIGFVIAFGVLLDTFVVRSILVPAIVFDVGPRFWRPSRLAGVPDHPELEARDAAAPAG